MTKSFFILFLAVAALFAAGSGNISSWQSFGGAAGDVSSISVLESDQSHMVLEISIPGFWLYDSPANGNTWDSVELPEYYSQGRVGLPDLPSITNLFAMPFGTEAVISVEEVTSTVYANMNILPRQTPDVDMDHAPYPFVISEDFYNNDESYPSLTATVDNEGVWSGLNVARLVVNPFSYNPSTGNLEAASSIILRVDFEGSVSSLAEPVNPSMVPAMEQNVLNWDVFEDAAAPVEGSRDDGVEYVFVCTTDNVDWVSELFETHHYLGLHTRVETLTAPATTTDIKNAITSNYTSGVTRFACIVGDYDDMPSYDYGSFVGDYYYALMDAGDYPDLSVGRLTGDSAQIVHQVDKIINGYMDFDFTDSRTPGIIPSETVLAAHEQDYPGKYTQCCNQVAAYPYSQCDITFTKVYPPEGGTKSDVIDAINGGIGTVGYRGHGSWYSWQWSPGWVAGDIYGLTNSFRPPVFNIACLNGLYNYPTTCLAEAWQWATNGASGNLAASASSYTTPNHTYMKQIYIALFDTGTFRACEAIMEATVYVIVHHGSLGITNARCYIWFGDPAMDIWTFDSAGEPGVLNISHPASILPGNQDITITVTDNGTPVEGANVTLTDGIDNYGNGMTFYEEGTTNSSGQVTVNVTVPSSGTVHIGAYKHDYCYDIKWVTIGTGIEDPPENAPALQIDTPFPNPVLTGTSIGFTVPSSGKVTLSIFDVSGRVVETIFDGQLEGGTHSVEWNTANRIQNGLYFVRLITVDGSVSTRVLVIR